MAISLSNRSCPYEFNASIDCWLKTTSHYDVIVPSTVSTTKNAELLTSRNLCHLSCAEIDAVVENELGATHLNQNSSTDYAENDYVFTYPHS